MRDDPTKHQTKRKLLRYLYSRVARIGNRAELNRKRLYEYKNGLRIVALHETRGQEQVHRLERLIEVCDTTFDWISISDLDEFCAGKHFPTKQDQLLLTFDDGHADNFAAAELLESKGIQALFFVIPSFLDRNVTEYYEYHRANGVDSYRFAWHHEESRGLSRTQVKEMAAMGHRIGGHNYAHRDLGKIHDAKNLSYEIERPIDELCELLNRQCNDFAFGFGLPQNLSVEASELLSTRCMRIYSSVRGLNILGQTPKYLLREPANLWYPLSFTLSALEGSLDHRALDSWVALEHLGGPLLPAGSVA